MEPKFPTQLGGMKLGGSNKKSTPIDICKRDDIFGEWDITYPLLSIQKPYFGCNLSLMIKSEELFYQNVSSQFHGGSK